MGQSLLQPEPNGETEAGNRERSRGADNHFAFPYQAIDLAGNAGTKIRGTRTEPSFKRRGSPISHREATSQFAVLDDRDFVHSHVLESGSEFGHTRRRALIG